MKSHDEILKIASEALRNEASAVEKLVDYLNGEFVEAVKQIYQSKGRVVVTGIGKSAIIANKIVATLNSTGTPAIFMHAADAVHGDLGIIQQDDVVICVSKSGNTAEIKVLVSMLKSGGNKLIALVGNLDSYLAAQADYVLNSTVEKEACPNNLAPTSSTTAQLALGDALAIALLNCRDFSSEDFAKFHPGGSLGKKLYLKVSDLVAHHEKPVVKESDDIKAVILEISSKRIGATAVLNGQGNLKGIITDGDLRRMMEKHSDISELCASDIMTTNPKSIQASELAVNAVSVIEQNNISQLVVKDGEEFTGFIHFHDLLREGLI